MKKLLCFSAALLLFSLTAYAAQTTQEVERALPREARELIEGVDAEGGNALGAGLRSIWDKCKSTAQTLLRRRVRTGTMLVLIAVFCALASELSEPQSHSSRLVTMAGGLCVTLLSVGQLDTLMGMGKSAIEEMTVFSRALLPTLAAATAASGSVTGAAVRQVTTVLFSDLLVQAIRSFLMPMLQLYVAALAAGYCFSDERLIAAAQMLKTVCTKLLTLSVLAFTVYLTAAGVFAANTDAAARRVTRAAISGAVPVVGGILSEAAEAVLAGASVVKGTLGIFGVLGVLAVCAYPFLHLAIEYLLYQAAAFLSSLVGERRLCELIRALGGAFGLLLGMVGACSLSLLISVLASVAAVTP